MWAFVAFGLFPTSLPRFDRKVAQVSIRHSVLGLHARVLLPKLRLINPTRA